MSGRSTAALQRILARGPATLDPPTEAEPVTPEQVTALNTKHAAVCGCAMCQPNGVSSRWLKGEM